MWEQRAPCRSALGPEAHLVVIRGIDSPVFRDILVLQTVDSMYTRYGDGGRRDIAVNIAVRLAHGGPGGENVTWAAWHPGAARARGTSRAAAAELRRGCGAAREQLAAWRWQRAHGEARPAGGGVGTADMGFRNAPLRAWCTDEALCRRLAGEPRRDAEGSRLVSISVTGSEVERARGGGRLRRAPAGGGKWRRTALGLWQAAGRGRRA